MKNFFKKQKAAPEIEHAAGLMNSVTVIVLLSFSVYFTSIFNGFVYDDSMQIVTNRWIRSFTNISEIFSTNAAGFDNTFTTNYYRPFMYLSYMVLYKLAGSQPFLYHLVNVLFHCATAVMVLLVSQRISWSGEKSFRGRMSMPFLAAAIFALHPIHTEAVMWVSSLPDVAMTLFIMLSLFFYIRAKEKGYPLNKDLVFSLTFYSIAVFLKEPAITFPAVLVIYDLVFRKDRSTLSLSRYIPYAIITGLYFMARAHALGGITPYNRYSALSVGETILNIVPLFPTYLRMLIFPLNLNAFYAFHPVSSIFEPRVIFSFIAIIAFLTIIIITLKKNRQVFFCLALIVIPLLPALYLPALGENPVAERYLYLPSSGFAMLAGLFSVWVYRRVPKRLFMGVLIVILGLCSSVIINRASVWENDFTLWADTVTKSPESSTAHKYYGYGLYTQKKFPEAIEQYKISLQLNYKDPETHHNLAVAYCLQGMVEEGIEEYRTALSIQPQFTEALIGLGYALSQKGKADEAFALCREALKQDHYSAEAHACLAVIYGNSGMFDMAISEFEQATSLNPENSVYRENLIKARKLKETMSGY